MIQIPKHLAAEIMDFSEDETDFDEELNRLIGWCDAYPEDVFTPLEGFKIPIEDSIGDYDTLEKRNLITRASAHMGRHMIAKALKPAILHLRELVDLVADGEKRIAELAAENRTLRNVGITQQETIERLQARVEVLEADIGLLTPVCSASSGGMVEGIMCPRCKGGGIVAATEPESSE